MHRNFGVCPHCTVKGLPGVMWKLVEKTPNMTMSDGKSFHLVLFSGPDSVRAASGGVLANRLVVQFYYVHDRLGSDAHWTSVLMTNPGDSFESVKTQLGNIVPKLAESLEMGDHLAAEYSFDSEHLLELRNMEGFKRKLQPLCPVAVKLHQTEIHAPVHGRWGAVNCDSCGEQFEIGPNQIYGSRITAEETAKRLEAVLAEDHGSGRPHLNAYEFPD